MKLNRKELNLDQLRPLLHHNNKLNPSLLLHRANPKQLMLIFLILWQDLQLPQLLLRLNHLVDWISLVEAAHQLLHNRNPRAQILLQPLILSNKQHSNNQFNNNNLLSNSSLLSNFS